MSSIVIVCSVMMLIPLALMAWLTHKTLQLVDKSIEVLKAKDLKELAETEYFRKVTDNVSQGHVEAQQEQDEIQDYVTLHTGETVPVSELEVL